ncbi:MAG: hypothetical protein O3C21_00300, partial [Verrucomicrobia bacterium]|nr:hypothetical protein [Verrucomicrobiota bacterium]
GSWMAGFGVVVLVIIGAISYISRKGWAASDADEVVPTVVEDVSLDDAKAMSKAKAVARKFVLATSISERLQYVRYPGKVAALMVKDRTMNWEEPLPVGAVLEYDTPYRDNTFFRGCYVEDDLEKVYDVQLMSVQSIDDLPTEGRNLIVVARVGDNVHVRIFGADGGEFFDRTEMELEAGLSLVTLKDAFRSGASLENLTAEEKDTLKRSALVASGYSKRKRFPFEVEMRPDGFLIDWEAFAEYNEVPWQQVLKERSNVRDYSMRVVSILDDYYDYQFTEDRYTCFRIENRSRTLGLYAYAPKTAWVEEENREHLKEKIALEGVDSTITSFIQVKIRFPENPTPEPMAEIVSFLARDWHTIPPGEDERYEISIDSILGRGSEEKILSKPDPDANLPLAPKGSWRN